MMFPEAFARMSPSVTQHVALALLQVYLRGNHHRQPQGDAP